MADPARTKKIALIAAGVVVALLAGATAGWLARGSKVRELEDEIAMLSDFNEEGESSEPTGTIETTAGVETEEPAAIEQPPAATEEVVPPATGASATGPTERQPGIVLGVTNSGGTNILRIDYIQFLTGGEANDAAAAHGDETPVPNDYYIVNDNPKIREFPIQPGIPVFVVTTPDGLSDADGHTITLAQWIAELSGPHADAFKGGFYWVTITNGTVTAIEAQYLP